MKIFLRVVSLFLFMFVIASAEAKTIKYDLTQINVNNGPVRYDGLDFFGATSAVLTITKTPPSTDVKLTSLEITFPNAAKLMATNFKLVEGTNKYRVIVNGAWIYKEIIVQVDNVPFQINQPLQIEVFVSDRTAYNNPVTDIQPTPQSLLFTLMGKMRDATTPRIVDTLSTVIFNKKVNLYLRDRLVSNDSSMGRESFAIEALWYGKGAKILYVPASIPPFEFDDVEIVGMSLQGPSEDPLIVIKYKNRNGSEMLSTPITLQEILGRAYGPNTFN